MCPEAFCNVSLLCLVKNSETEHWKVSGQLLLVPVFPPHFPFWGFRGREWLPGFIALKETAEFWQLKKDASCNRLVKQMRQISHSLRSRVQCHSNFSWSLFIAVCRACCTPPYTTHLWCNHSKANINKIKLPYDGALRVLCKYPVWMC